MSTTTEYIIFKPTEIENSLRGDGVNKQTQWFIRFDWSFSWTRLIVSSITIDEQILSSYLNTESNPGTPYVPQYPGSPATKKYVDDSVSWTVSKWSTAPSSPAEWQLWYDTTNDVLKVYDWTNWNEVGGGSDDINTKTFYLSSTSDLTNAQAAYDWYLAGNNPIIIYSQVSYSIIDDSVSGGVKNISFVRNNPEVYVGNSSSYYKDYLIRFTINQTTSKVESITATGNTIISWKNYSISVLETNKNYSTPYTPQYDWSPATKKYVDDSVIEYNAGEGIEIWTVQDYSAMRWPCAEGFHVPTQSERSNLNTLLTTLWRGTVSSANWYIKLPKMWYRNKDTSDVIQTTSYYWTHIAINSQAYIINIYNWFTLTSSYRTHWAAIRWFKDSAVVPDSSWTTLYDGSSVATWAWIFHNATLWLISISGDWQTWITIADKNVWATTVWNSGDTLSEANCGWYFQRWNNYMFPFTWTVTTSSTQVDATNYWPWNYYSSNVFITGNSWDSSNNKNLRWWVTWVVTLDNAINNKGVLSVNGQTGDVPNVVTWDGQYVIKASTTAPASWTANNIITLVIPQ